MIVIIVVKQKCFYREWKSILKYSTNQQDKYHKFTLETTMPFTLPELGYAYDALEPHIDAKTMEIHHSKHHAAYIAKGNAALEGTEWDGKCYGEILGRIKMVPETIRTAVQNNVGGHANHSLFWSK